MFDLNNVALTKTKRYTLTYQNATFIEWLSFLIDPNWKKKNRVIYLFLQGYE